MAEFSLGQEVADESVFTYGLNDGNNGGLAGDACTTSESTPAGNLLIDTLGAEFFSTGTMQVREVFGRVMTIKTAFEDAASSDEDLIMAIEHAGFALINFLLNVASSNGGLGSESQDAAAKCLAFAGDIHSGLWEQYGTSPSRLVLVLRAAKAAALRMETLLASLPARAGPNDHGGYLGYDERDAADYDMEGYASGGGSGRSAELEELVPQIQEAIMVWLLFLQHAFSEPLPSIAKKVVSCRTRKSPAGRYSSRRMLKASQQGAAELVTDVFAAEVTLDTLDVVAYFTELAGLLLGLLLKKGLAEEAHNNCVKVVTYLNAQLPRQQQADTNEIAALFVVTDSGQPGENLSQDLLHLLNEVGYPHIHGAETLAVVRMCKDVLNVELAGTGSEEGEGDGGESYGDGPASTSTGGNNSPRPELHYARGHFYTNDVKVIVDIVARELSNVPHNTTGLTSATLQTGRRGTRTNSTAEQVAAVLHGNVRFAYLELLDALISKSTWSSHGDCYMKDALRGLLEETADRPEDQRAQPFARDLLQKYAYYLN